MDLTSKAKIKKEYEEHNYSGVSDYIKTCTDYEYMRCNVLTIEPKKVIKVDGNPKIKSRLEKKGVHVFTYDESEISLKDTGDLTCLTKPFLRVTPY
tara:strand:- start:83 stop:370 length:288 start_codon:yes stop_codon:yes gene_type:complete